MQLLGLLLPTLRKISNCDDIASTIVTTYCITLTVIITNPNSLPGDQNKFNDTELLIVCDEFSTFHRSESNPVLWDFDGQKKVLQYQLRTVPICPAAKQLHRQVPANKIKIFICSPSLFSHHLYHNPCSS